MNLSSYQIRFIKKFIKTFGIISVIIFTGYICLFGFVELILYIKSIWGKSIAIYSMLGIMGFILSCCWAFVFTNSIITKEDRENEKMAERLRT